MTYNEVKFISELVGIAAAISAWFVVKWIEKRLGCKNDWELMSLVWRKINLLWQPRPKQGD
jgi:hypothetical protein